VERKEGESWQPVTAQDSETEELRLTDLKAGVYRWSVTSQDPRGGAGKAALPFTFTVEDMLKIEWVETAPPSEYEYHSPTPSIHAEWKPLLTAPSTYRFKIAADDKSLDSEAWHNTRQSTLDLPVAADGKYQMVVEALNDAGQPFAQSEAKTIVVKPHPLLPAPQWAANTPAVLKADSKGDLRLGWEQVEGAQNYLMILESTDGTLIDQREVKRTTASLTRLKPGQYQVHLKSIDDFKRPGLEGDKRELEVPTPLQIQAPKIKALKVK
jgi:hypothetical protein